MASSARRWRVRGAPESKAADRPSTPSAMRCAAVCEGAKKPQVSTEGEDSCSRHVHACQGNACKVRTWVACAAARASCAEPSAASCARSCVWV